MILHSGNPVCRTLAFFSLALLAAAAAGAQVTEWKPKGISSPLYESHAAFDPLTGDFYFVRSNPDFHGWRILASHCGTSGWSEPKPPLFAASGLEADPYFTPDGKHIYFISTRATGSQHSKDLDIWRVDRDAKNVWMAPVRLPSPVNSFEAEWFPRPALDGWLYFGSKRAGGLGKNDIWRARLDASGQWRVENAGPSINTDGNEYEALPSPDGQRLIIAADDGMYESHKSADGWSPRVKMGPEVNANGSELGAVLSPSGKSMLFARDTKGPDSGEFFLLREDGKENWPPTCPSTVMSR